MKKTVVILLLGFVFTISMQPQAFPEIRFTPGVSTGIGASSIAVDTNGHIYLVGIGGCVYFAKSTDCGFAFGPKVQVDDASSAGYKASMTIDTDGNTYVVWHDMRNGDNNIYFSKSTDGGASFRPDIRVNDATSVSIGYPSIAVDLTGDIYVTWRDASAIYFAKSSDGGASFETNVRVDDGASGGKLNPSIAVDADSNIYVVWDDYRSEDGDIYFAKSTDGGASFGPNVQVNDIIIGDQYYPAIALDTNGEIYVVWAHDQDRSRQDRKIYFAKSTDGGASFGPSVRVDDATTGDQFYPAIALDVNGAVYVVWRDTRDGYNHIYFAKSTDFGASFKPNIQVDDLAGFPSIAVDTNGVIYVAGDGYVSKGIDDVIPNEPPVANAGDDQRADANELVTLDGSASYDLDGGIAHYSWKRLPDETVLYSGPEPRCEIKALGRAEEVIELTVTDCSWGWSRDTVSILNRKIGDNTDRVDQIDRQVNPILTITNPPAGDTVSGMVSVDVSSNNEGNMAYCYLYVDGKYIDYDNSSPFSLNWDSRYWANGLHTIKVRAYFGNGIYANTTTTITVSSQNDPVITPSISITSPSNGETVNGTITITTDAAAANFNYVYYRLDGKWKECDSSFPFEFSLDTTALSNGTHTIKVSAYHRQGFQTVNHTISVNVNN